MIESFLANDNFKIRPKHFKHSRYRFLFVTNRRSVRSVSSTKFVKSIRDSPWSSLSRFFTFSLDRTYLSNTFDTGPISLSFCSRITLSNSPNLLFSLRQDTMVGFHTPLHFYVTVPNTALGNRYTLFFRQLSLVQRDARLFDFLINQLINENVTFLLLPPLSIFFFINALRNLIERPTTDRLVGWTKRQKTRVSLSILSKMDTSKYSFDQRTNYRSTNQL